MEERTIIDPSVGAGGAPSGYGDATQVISGGGLGAPEYVDRTQQAITVTCPVCSTPNMPSERYCQDCGFMFGSAAEVAPLPDLSEVAHLSDAAAQREFELQAGVNLVGRDAADILLADPTVSRRHAQVTLEDGRIVVEDLGSTNGTFVNGQPVRAGTPVTAYEGDTVKFGSVALAVRLPGSTPRPAETAPQGSDAVEAGADGGQLAGWLRLADGTEHPLRAGVTTIGRRSGNQVVLADAFASGKHAEIRVEADGSVILVDVGSTNGTFVNGQRIAPNTPIPLTPELTLAFGKSQAVFVPAPAESTPEDAEAAAPEDESGSEAEVEVYSDTVGEQD